MGVLSGADDGARCAIREATLSLTDIFKAYDVRGVYPDQLDEAAARAVGTAFAVFTKARAILVARDMRASSPALESAFVEGATEAGVDVVRLGLASTDLLYFASGKLSLPGVMFTASHNPAQYNGMKFCLEGAAPISGESGLAEICALAEAVLRGESIVSSGTTPGSASDRDLLADYASHCRSFVDASKLKPLKVVADAANGMGGLVAPAVFDGLPIELTPLFFDLDGTFPNHPADPIQPENLEDLKARILMEGADLGLAFDGDADRVFLVDDKAQPLSGSLTTSLVAKGILEKHPGEKVIYNLICSRAVPEVIRENGGEPVRTRVGHSFIKAVMAESGAIFGGEHSGHYYFRDNFRADSGLIASLIVMEQLSVSGKPLSELRIPLERYVSSGEINSRVDDPEAVMKRIAATFEDGTQDWTDGLTVSYPDWWFNLRPSNTEPLLRLNMEALNEGLLESELPKVLEAVRG